MNKYQLSVTTDKNTYTTNCFADSEKDAIKQVTYMADSFGLIVKKINWCLFLGSDWI